MKLLITGGAGFIGSNFVRYQLQHHPEYELVVLDKLTYAGRRENLHDLLEGITFIQGDICRKTPLSQVKGCDAILNFAAETHVDRSIVDAAQFVRTNVLGTYNLLEYARRQGVSKFIQISTDEVYGSLERGSSRETDTLEPSSAYAASKAGADLLVGAYHRTYGLPVLITRSSNNFGPYQYPEKLIPLLITNALRDRALPIYGDGLNVRDWLHVQDNCAAIDLILHEGKPGETYNVGGGNERRNIDVAYLILAELGKPRNLTRFVPDRLGHDRRYSLDCAKIRQLGWQPRQDFEPALQQTIEWYRHNRWWWEPLVNQ